MVDVEEEVQAQRGTSGSHEALCELFGDAPRMPRTRAPSANTNTNTSKGKLPLSVEEGGGCSGLQQLPVTPTQSPHVRAPVSLTFVVRCLAGWAEISVEISSGFVLQAVLGSRSEV